MKKIKISPLVPDTSVLAIGCMRLAPLTVNEAVAVLEAAASVGINFYDHADIYGKGASEERFAEAMKVLGWQREQVVVQSKCGIRPGFFDFSKEHIIASVDASLKRLATDYLDVLLLHRPDVLFEPEEVAEAFSELEQSGKVRSFGVSNQNPAQMQLLQSAVTQPLVVNQLQLGPAHTPIIDAGLNVNMKHDGATNRDGDVLSYMRQKQMVLQPWSPFQVDLAQGLFMNHPQYTQLTECLYKYASQYGVSFEAMVIAWLLRIPGKIQPIIGSMNPERIIKMAEGTAVQLSREAWYEIYRSAGNILP